MNYKFNHLALGGTFDHLHKGHEVFLDFAFNVANKVSIGITNDKMAKKKDINGIEDLEIRLSNLKKWLEKKHYISRSHIIIINDIFGTTLSDKSLDALLVTRRSVGGGRQINLKRSQKKMSHLNVLICPFKKGTDGTIISSSRVRKGEIDRDGFNYFKFLKESTFQSLSNELREKLKKPLGILHERFDKKLINLKGPFIVTVGDKTTEIFSKNGLVPHLAIIDFKIGRKKSFNSLRQLRLNKTRCSLTVASSAGTISKQLIGEVIKVFSKGLQKPLVIKIKGEEDLAVLPIVLASPLGTYVYYGQPGKGLVEVTVTEDKKTEILSLMRLFKHTAVE